MNEGSAVKQRIREMRWRQAQPSLLSHLNEAVRIPSSSPSILPLDESDALLKRYVARLQQGGELTLHWPPHERHLVEAWLSSIARTVVPEDGLWLSLQADYQIPVVVRVPLRPMLEQALESFVSWSSDLMLVTDHAADGLCVELNHHAEGDAFDITAWGEFVTAAEK